MTTQRQNPAYRPPARSDFPAAPPVRSGLTAFAVLGVLVGLAAAARGAPDPRPAPLTRVCVTEWSGYYGSSEADFRKRFALYERVGVDTLRVETGWLDRPALLRALRGTRLRLKMILYVLGIPPEYAARLPGERMVDQHGAADWHLGPWSKERAETTLQTATAELRKLRESGLADRVDEVVVDLGPAGEGIYPANWTLGRAEGEEAYWCYSAGAQAAFRDAMRARYGTVDKAGEAWRLDGPQRFTRWEDVAIPPPGTPWARGPFWHDVLVWYRDAKRAMALERIEQTKRLAREWLGERVRCIVYLPGWAYTQADWDRAVETASGPASIRLMMDNDWLMRTALAEGCVLQYTGVENAGEVRSIVSKLRASGSQAHARMWGENAGVESSGRNPIWLAQVVNAFGLRGIDFTWSNWLFERDGVTPNPTLPRFEHAVRMVRARAAGRKPPPPYVAAEAARQTEPGTWLLQCVAATRIMSLHPHVIKGDDPEIAVVEGGQTQRMLLRFPLELLPAGARIARARLVMHRYRDYGDDREPADLGVFRMVRPWESVAATWNLARQGVAWKRPGGDAQDRTGRPYAPGAGLAPWSAARVAPFTRQGEPVEWDVTALVKQLAAGPDHGMMVAALQGGRPLNKSFASPGHPDPAMRPALHVELVRPVRHAPPRRRPASR